MKVLALLFLICLPSVAWAATAVGAGLDANEEARAVAIGNNLRCVVCQSSSINDSQADMARDLRQLVRDKIEDGWDDRRIYDYVQTRYGDFILLRPPFQVNTWILWLSPLLFLGIAFCASATLIRRSTRKKGRTI